MRFEGDIMISEFLKNNYNLNVLNITQMTTGAGGNTYKIQADDKMYVLKLTITDSMNHPKLEPVVCEKLNSNGINTLKFIKNINNEYSTNYNDYVANVYEYIEGNIVKYNSMDKHLVNECAMLLANINIALDKLDLPMGLSQGFFDYMKPDKALKSYLKSLEKAKKINDLEIIYNIEKRIELLNYIKDWSFDASKLTYCNSHGDFTNNQIILNDKINIIDFTACCRQPIIWELTRFFFHADISAKDGKLDVKRYYEYLYYYLKKHTLADYDFNNIFKLYFYQILVCDYYNQYFNEEDEVKRNDYLNQANFASKILNANFDLIKNMK